MKVHNTQVNLKTIWDVNIKIKQTKLFRYVSATTINTYLHDKENCSPFYTISMQTNIFRIQRASVNTRRQTYLVALLAEMKHT